MNLMRKGLVVVVIVLLVGMSISSTGINVDNKSLISYGDNTLYVGGDGPGNYTKIQDAIDNASNGDTVFVYNGIYYEHLRIDKDINLFGEDKENTIIDAEGIDTAVEIGANVNLSGFTIRNAVEGISNFVPPPPDNIYKFDVNGNIIESNEVGLGLGGTFDCVIQNNNISNNHLGINFFYADDFEVKNNNFLNNDKHAYFEYILFLQFMPKIKWSANHWDDWNLRLPKFIRGEKVVVMVFRPGYVIKNSICPWYNVDWNPSKKPVNI